LLNPLVNMSNNLLIKKLHVVAFKIAS